MRASQELCCPIKRYLASLESAQSRHLKSLEKYNSVPGVCSVQDVKYPLELDRGNHRQLGGDLRDFARPTKGILQ